MPDFFPEEMTLISSVDDGGGGKSEGRAGGRRMTWLCKCFLSYVKGATGEVTEVLAEVCSASVAGNNCWH